jgi:hypothetical protein
LIKIYNRWFQRRRFLEIDLSETRIACGGDNTRGEQFSQE